MKVVLFILLLIYPFFSFMLANDDLLPNRIWGVAVVSISALIFLSELDFSEKKFNVFYQAGFFISIAISVSLVVNHRLQWFDLYPILKYTLAFFVAGVVYNANISVSDLRIIFKINRFLLLLFTFLIGSRLLEFGIGLADVIAVRDEIWYGRPVFFALFYSSFALAYILESYIFNKNLILKYGVFVPVLFLGARSILIGFIIVFFILVLTDFFKFKRNSVLIVGIVIFIVFTAYLSANFFNLYSSGNVFFNLIASQADAVRGSDFDINTFSSGRIDIISYYFSTFEVRNLFFGLGGLDTNVKLGLHNDFLDFFFQYGIFGFLIFIFYYLVKILLPLLKRNLSIELKNFSLGLVFFFLLQNLTNPFISTLTSLYFFIIVVFVLKIPTNIQRDVK